MHVNLIPKRHQTPSKAQDAVSGRGLSEIHGTCAYMSTAAAVCNIMSHVSTLAKVFTPCQGCVGLQSQVACLMQAYCCAGLCLHGTMTWRWGLCKNSPTVLPLFGPPSLLLLLWLSVPTPLLRATDPSLTPGEWALRSRMTTVTSSLIRLDSAHKTCIVAAL